jgi:PST family polysaccharide transporter
VGIYKNAMSTESGIIAVITAIYSTIMVSLLSREQKDMGAMTKILCTYQRLISYLLIPIGIGMFVYRDFLTFVFFGNGWSEAAIVIGLFGITDCFRAATGLFSMSAFTSAGKPLWNIVINATSLIWIVISFFCFSGFGFDTFVIFRSFASVVCSIIALILGWFVLKINPFILLVNLLHPLIYSLIMSGVAFLQMSFSTSTVFNSIGIVACMVSYFLFFFLFDKKDFIFLFRMFAGKEVVAVGEAGCRSNK